MFSGIVLALAMYATGSTIASVLVHGLFNLIGLFGQPYLNAFYTITGGTDGLFIFIVCMLTVLSAALFCTFAAQSYRARAKYSKIPDRKLLPPSDKVFEVVSKLVLDPFAIAATVVYIAVIIIELLI